jgi:hypothetical protein|tara:strand:- start:428 stop:1024 length:597 start_codon:yes stop_codon:yes gene_type:complete
MSLIIKDDSQQSKYPQLSIGVHNARCIRVIDLGTQRNEYKGEVSWKRKVMITWEVHNKDSEEPFEISKFYNHSMYEKANLSIDLVSWRGRPFTEREKKGFDIGNLVGKVCQLNVIEGNNGKPKIQTVLPTKDEVGIQYNKSLVFSIEDYQKGELKIFNQLREGIRNMILESKELEGQSQEDVKEHGESDIEPDDAVPF